MNAGVKIILRSTMYVDGKELGIWKFVRFHPPELTRAVFNSQCEVYCMSVLSNHYPPAATMTLLLNIVSTIKGQGMLVR